MKFILFAFCFYYVNGRNISNVGSDNKPNINANKVAHTVMEGIYWEVKPFIFVNEDGELDGIIPKIFHEGQRYCGSENISELMYFRKKMRTRKEYFDLLRSSTNYGELDLMDITKQKAVWFPDLSYMNKKEINYENSRGLKSFQIMKSKYVAVIVPRYLISLPNKILRGIFSCQQILVLAFMLSVLFGIIIWMIERSCNKQFSKSFIQGTSTGIWWSLVSMTTVGYGDVVPRSVAGRLVAIVWLFVGVMVACVMTATVTEVVTGVGDLSIYEKKVAVLENSLELKVAQDDYRAIPVPAESYEEAFKMVQNGVVFAAVINADIAAWFQEEIQDDSQSIPLRVVKKLPASLYINCLISNKLSKEAKDAFNCMYKQADEVYSRSIEHYRRYCHTETLYIDSLGDLFRKNIMYQFLIGTLLVLILFGFLFEIHLRFSKDEDKEVTQIELLENGKEPDSDKKRQSIQNRFRIG